MMSTSFWRWVELISLQTGRMLSIRKAASAFKRVHFSLRKLGNTCKDIRNIRIYLIIFPWNKLCLAEVLMTLHDFWQVIKLQAFSELVQHWEDSHGGVKYDCSNEQKVEENILYACWMQQTPYTYIHTYSAAQRFTYPCRIHGFLFYFQRI